MNEEMLSKTYEEVVALKDLFLRRLMDDKVKMAAISQLREQNELLQKSLDEKNLLSFVRELLMICDRIEGQEEANELADSVEEEILELLARREISQMEKPVTFDPRYHNAVGAEPATEAYPDKSIIKVVRKGYFFRNQVLRPADVIVAVQTVSEEN